MLKILQQDSAFRLNYLDRNIRKLTISGIFTLIVVLVLLLYLFPFSYMVTTSLKNRAQITRNIILPLTQLTYTYEGVAMPGYRVSSGDSFPILVVPTDDGAQELALVVTGEGENPNIFLDPISLNIIEWMGDVNTLPQADQIVLFRYREDDVSELGLVKSSDYPVYELNTEAGLGQWALIRSPEHIFLDVDNPTAGVIKWDGDVDSLAPAPAFMRYKYNGETNLELGLTQLASYDVYESPEGGRWALVRQADETAGTTTVVIDFDPVSEQLNEVIEWDGDVSELQPVYQPETYRFRGRDDGGIGLVRNTDYPLFEVPIDGETQRLALVNVGNPNQFIVPNDDEIQVVEWEGDTANLTPVYQQAQILQVDAVDRANGLKKNVNYPLYLVPTDDGEQRWALIRVGTQTAESIFLNIQNEDEVETISLETNLDSLTPVVEPAVYNHFGSPVPDWSLQAGDKLLLYRSPRNSDKQWALVAGYTPASGKDSVFLDPDNPDDGVFMYEDGYYGSLKTVDELDLQFENFERAWNEVNFPRLLFNTTAIALLGLTGTLVSCTIVAYGFARFPIPGKNILFLVLIATIVLPRQVTLVPTFAFFSQIGWTNTWLPLIVPHFFANAYNVFLLRQFIQTIPREMDEAAMIDGAGPFRILISIIVPQAWPALVAAGLFHIVFAWNDYFEPLIYTLGAPEIQPISVGIQQYNFVYDTQYEMIQATSIMALILPVMLFFFAQRFFMRGVVITGVDK